LAKVSRQSREKLTNEIRDLLNLGVSEDHIISHLKIGRATFFRYKKRVIKQIIKQWEPRDDEIEYQYAMLRKSLEDCYRINYQIANDIKKSPLARSKASEMFVVARAQLVRLAEKGPIFKPQLTL